VRVLSVLLLVLSVALWRHPTGAAANGEIARGVALVHACAACHGPNGHSQGAIPSIETLSPEAVSAALKAFRAGTRQGTVMLQIARGLDEADINAVAAYVATLRGR
jgi:sulfide dehydrogenase cytochrome subunit